MKQGTIVKTTFIAGIFITLAGAYMKIEHSGAAEAFLIVGLISLLSFIIAAIYEVRTSNRISNSEKTMWTIGFIFFAGIAGLIYFLMGRKRVVTNSRDNHITT